MIDPKLLDACVHCGLCLPACPTYDVTGSELDSPRGRIVLVRGLSEGTIAETGVAAEHLDLCLGCRACETACPSGVRYGRILEQGRSELRRQRPPGFGARLLHSLFLRKGLGTRAGTTAMMRLLWLARRTGLHALASSGKGRAGILARIAPDPRWRPWSRTVARTLPATGTRRGAVAFLPGCVMDQGFADVHAASVALLQRAGFDVHVPRGPLCCGALLAHVGDTQGAAAPLARLTAAFEGIPCDAVIVNAAGCGSHLKEAAWPLAGTTFDLLEWLGRHGLGFRPAAIGPRFGAPQGKRLRVAYQDPCHLRHGQRIEEAPRRLLTAIPDVLLVPLADPGRCCGSAGVYNVAQPAMAEEQLARKLETIHAARPHVVATANPGCHLQIAAGLATEGLKLPVVHVAELLAASIPKGPSGASG